MKLIFHFIRSMMVETIALTKMSLNVMKMKVVIKHNLLKFFSLLRAFSLLTLNPTYII